MLALVTVGALATPGSAHARLTGTSPGDGASLAVLPPSVRLTFSDPLDPQFVQVRVTGPQGPVAGSPAVRGATVTVPTPAGGPGRWTVDYRVVSRDGHPVSGSVSFTVTGPATPTGSGTSPAGPVPAPVPTTQARGPAPPGPGPGGTTGSADGTGAGTSVASVPTSSVGIVGPGRLLLGGLVVLAAVAAATSAAVGRRPR
jgi:methionine-rich copper-binding protein CopC